MFPMWTAACGAIFIFFCIFFQLFVSLPLHASNVSAYTLPNGLRVILAPVDNVEATCVMLYQLTGVRDDPPEARGVSFLYQDLMLSETKSFDVLDSVIFVKRNGGFTERIIGYDSSFVYFVVPDSDLDTALWFESERISSLKLSDENINIQKNTIYQRYSRIINSNVPIRAAQWVKSKVLEGTPYQIPLYGNLEEIRYFNNNTVREAYQNFKSLNKIIMVISGKFNKNDLRNSINKHFAPLNYNQAKKSPSPLSGQPFLLKKYVYENWVIDNLPEPFVIYGFRVPSKFNYDYLYIDFLRYYLADDRVSRLERDLNNAYDLDVTVRHELTDFYDANAFLFAVFAKERVNLEKSKIIINKKLDSLMRGTADAVSQSDLKNIKSLMEIDFLKHMSQLEKRSLFLAENYHLGGDLTKVEADYINRIRAITVFDICRIARKYFDKNNRVNLYVYPK